MNYILTVNYFPIDSNGRIRCVRRTFVRFYSDFVSLKRKLRHLSRTTCVLDYHIEERPAKV